MSGTRKAVKQDIIRLKYLIDPWSVPHFLFGIVVALAALAFAWPVFLTFFTMLILALLWEVLEKYFRLSEAPGNAWVDVLLPLIAFAAVFSIIDITVISQKQLEALFLVSVLLYICVNFFAWRARFEHDHDFQG